MEKHKRSENKILIAILCVLFVVIVGLVISIIAVDISKKSGSEGGGNENSEGGSSSQTDDTETWKGNDIEELNEKAEIQDAIREIPREDAIVYLDDKIEENEDPESDFLLRLTKVNVLYNGNDYEGALAEALKIENVDALSLQDKRQYYNVMRHIYLSLGNEAEANKYGELWAAVYDEMFDGGEAFYE